MGDACPLMKEKMAGNAASKAVSLLPLFAPVKNLFRNSSFWRCNTEERSNY